MLTNKEANMKFPFLISRVDWYTGRFLPPDEIDYDNSWWDDIPEGWREAFGEEMCGDLLNLINRADCADDFEILQIKEKFGSLRFCATGIPDKFYPEYREICKKYQEKSDKICISCGQPATRNWDMLPICEKCYNEFAK